MRCSGHWQLRSVTGVLAAVFLLSAAGTVPSEAAALSRTGAAQTTAPVSAAAAPGTPELDKTTATETVRQLVQCGGTMYAVGSFTEIKQGHIHYLRSNVFSFSATAPYAVTSWNPDVNGVVNTIAFDGADCSDAYLGGQFSEIGSTTVKDIAEVDTSTGAVNPAFAHSTNGQVNTMIVAGGHLLTGGAFTSVNGSSQPYYVSLDPATGLDDGYLQLAITGSYQYPGVFTNNTNVYNQQVSPDGTRLLAEGVFTSVGGQPRQQIFMLNLGAQSAALSGWTTAEFNTHCADKHPFYVKAAAWSPDDSTVYTGTTGLHVFQWTHTFPLTGPCDSVEAFPASPKAVSPEWANYDGCDSIFSIAADASTVYIGGHERWADNSNGCNHAGPGAVPSPGMGGFSSADGSLLLNQAGTAGMYSRSRGLGADDMLMTTAGLWIASDNYEAANSCAGSPDHAGICFLPYS
jgi:hypothetical protein